MLVDINNTMLLHRNYITAMTTLFLFTSLFQQLLKANPGGILEFHSAQLKVLKENTPSL